MPLRIENKGSAVRVWVKAVPGSSRDQVVGLLGDRLKVRVSAPAEGGRANKAVCATIAKALGIKTRQVSVDSGHTNAEKTVRIDGVSVDQVRAGFAIREQEG